MHKTYKRNQKKLLPLSKSKSCFVNHPKETVKDAGVCPACDETVKGKRGVRKTRMLQDHLFKICKKYPWSKKYEA